MKAVDYTVSDVKSKEVPDGLYPAVVLCMSSTGSCVYGPFPTLDEAQTFAQGIPLEVYEFITCTYLVNPKDTVIGSGN